MNERFAGIIYR